MTYFRVLLWVDKTKTKSWSSECEYQSYTYSTVELEGGVVESKSVYTLFGVVVRILSTNLKDPLKHVILFFISK